MKNFIIKIRYHGYSADFKVTSEDSPQGIEKAILDKLGKHEVKFEKDGCASKIGKWISYEEVNDDRRPIHYETVLGTRVATRASEGREA